MTRRASSTVGIAASWERIHAAFAASDSDHLQSLAKPASRESITKLESTLGVVLPKDFKESLAIHDGQKDGAEVGAFPGFYSDDVAGSYYLMSLKAIARDWKMLKSVKKSGDFDGLIAAPDPGVDASWWNLAWVPFAANGGGDYLCLDLNPTRGGVSGQVIYVAHPGPDRKLQARSFAQWLQCRADAVSRGDLPE